MNRGDIYIGDVIRLRAERDSERDYIDFESDQHDYPLSSLIKLIPSSDVK